MEGGLTVHDTSSTGDWGLDLALGGGVRMVSRLEGREPSSTTLIRGGPGAGKTILAYQTAVELASARGGDVAYACVELLPTELQAQIEGIWDSQKPPSKAAASRLLMPPFARHTAVSVAVYTAVLNLGPTPEAAPDVLGEGMEELVEAARGVGGTPKVLVVDSLSAGYGLSAMPREVIDAVVKYAVREGLVLLLLEEGLVGDRSEWAYAVDIVVELDHLDRTDLNAQLERKLWVVKNRFAPSVLGPHRFSIIRGKGVQVFPAPITYSTPWARQALSLPRRAVAADQDDLDAPGSWGLDGLMVEMRMQGQLAWPRFEDCSVFVTAPDAEVVRAVARGIGATSGSHGGDLWIDIGTVDTSFRKLPTSRTQDWVVGLGVPYLSSQRLVYSALDALRQWAKMDTQGLGLRRVLIGDLAGLRSFVSPHDLTRGLIVLLGVLRLAELPVVLFETTSAAIAGEREEAGNVALSPTGSVLPVMAGHADAVLEIAPLRRGVVETFYVVQLWHRLTGTRALTQEERSRLIDLGRTGA